jgi:Fur family transcriptional regulator, peroxide stress response regulator
MRNSSPQRELDRDLAAFRGQCRASGLALTHQREIIFRAVREMRTHPSPEAIYERVKREIPSISLGTVYKNIRTFIDAGLLREVSPHHGTLRLETHLAPHHHLVCSRCKAIVDIAEDDVEPVHWKRKPPAGCRVERYSVEFHGLCQACSAASS